jgi:hypothetical protein
MDNNIKEAFLTACSDSEFHGRWMTSDTWAELICLRFNLLDSNSFTGTQLNRVFQSRANTYICYYACERGKAHKTTPGVKWFHEINEALDLKIKFKTRKEKRALVINGTTLSENPNKRKIEEVEKAFLEPTTTDSTTISACIKTTSAPSSDLSMYWQSREAQAIFQPNESESSVLEAIHNQIELLKQGLISCHRQSAVLEELEHVL